MAAVVDLTVNLPFDDPYSRGGLAEKAAVFVAAQEIEARLKDKELLVGELGFGQGLAFLATYLAAVRVKGRFRFVSFELYPLAWEAVMRAWGEETLELPAELQQIAAWEALRAGWNRFELPHCSLEIGVGDARMLIKEKELQADAWFLDGHAPAKNPELWEEGLLMAVGERTVRGGTASTYSSAGVVKRGLEGAGFEVRKVAGFGSKREMIWAKKI